MEGNSFKEFHLKIETDGLSILESFDFLLSRNFPENSEGTQFDPASIGSTNLVDHKSNFRLFNSIKW